MTGHLSDEIIERARQLIGLYPHPRSALIPICHLAQEQDGWLTPEAVDEIAEILGIAPAEVLGTASFYDMLHTEPVGEYLVSICTNIACMLRGAYEVYERFQEELGVGPKGVTPDGLFSVEEVECIGACCWAPAVQVNYEFHDELKPDLVSGILDRYRDPNQDQKKNKEKNA